MKLTADRLQQLETVRSGAEIVGYPFNDASFPVRLFKITDERVDLFYDYAVPAGTEFVLRLPLAVGDWLTIVCHTDGCAGVPTDGSFAITARFLRLEERMTPSVDEVERIRRAFL